MSTKEIVAIALGANLDNPVQTIECAFQSLMAVSSMQLVVRSKLYQSKAVGPAGQPDYINAAALFEVMLEPLELLDQLLAMESEHGRMRDGARWGARVLDLDLIVYGDRIIQKERLKVPHPHAWHRCFVLAPLAEIAPRLTLPGYGKVTDLLEQCDTGVVQLLEESNG